MAPLVVLVVVTLGLRGAGACGARQLRSWPAALRGGLAAMFAVTGTSHFGRMREEMVAMVPPPLPAPGALVTATGVLELAGATGLLHRTTAPWAASGLSLVLVAMFPANAHAAAQGLTVGGSPAMPLAPRALLQAIFLAATTTAAVCSRRQGSGSSRPHPRRVSWTSMRCP